VSQSKTLFRRDSRGRLPPSPVRWAAGLLYVYALLSVASVAEFVIIGSPNATYVLNATTGIGLPVVLAPLVRHGYRWARIAFWIWAGLGTITFAIVEAGRPWGLPEIVTTVSALGFFIGVSVLLALPSSNQYFRRT
jgi:hypothetical protein